MATDTASLKALGDIRAEMARKDFDQKQLAAYLGISRAWISRRLSGETRLTIADVEMIADALGFDIEVVWHPQLAAEGER